MKNYGSLGPHCKNKSSLERIQIFIAATYYIKFYDEAFHIMVYLHYVHPAVFVCGVSMIILCLWE